MSERKRERKPLKRKPGTDNKYTFWISMVWFKGEVYLTAPGS